MSLINQALKKAQQDRLEGPQPGASGENRPTSYTATRAGNPAHATNFIIMKYLMGGLLLVAGLGAAIAFMVSIVKKPETVAEAPVTEFAVSIKPNNQNAGSTSPAAAPNILETPGSVQQAEALPTLNRPATTTATNQNQLQIQPAAPTTPNNSTPVATQPNTAAHQPRTAALAAPVSSPTEPAHSLPPSVATLTQPSQLAPPGANSTQAPQPNPNDLIQPPAEQPVLVGAQAPPAPKPKPKPTLTPKPNPNVIAFLEASRVTGVRIAGGKSKVVMNNRVFRLNSVVDTKTNLKIIEILKNEIQFVDESGLRYRKQF